MIHLLIAAILCCSSPLLAAPSFHPVEDNFPVTASGHENISNTIPHGYKRWGDMILPQDFFLNATSPDGRNVISFEQFRWPQGVIPYEIDWSLANSANLIGQAFQQYHQKTCLRFVPRTAQHRNYIHIFPGEGCYSNVGMINQGRQPVSLGQGCLTLGTIVHELGHAIGFFHEQNRSDRDNHITIYWQNIQSGMGDQFQKLDPSHNLLLNPFDVNSIMLYGDTAFSKDRVSKTMTSKQGSKLFEVYDKPGLSASDVQRINKAYHC